MMCTSNKITKHAQMNDTRPKIKKRKNREKNEKMENISSSIEGREVEEGQKFQY